MARASLKCTLVKGIDVMASRAFEAFRRWEVTLAILERDIFDGSRGGIAGPLADIELGLTARSGERGRNTSCFVNNGSRSLSRSQYNSSRQNNRSEEHYQYSKEIAASCVHKVGLTFFLQGWISKIMIANRWMETHFPGSSIIHQQITCGSLI